MHALEFLRGKATKGAKPAYAVYGDDAYLKKEVLAAIVRSALGPGADELAVSRFSGDQASLADVLDEVRTLPFLAQCRIVLVENADPFVTAHRRELETYAEHASSTGCLILSVKAWPANTRLAKLFVQHGLAVECKSPRESELPDWLVELARDQEKVTMDKDAARLLVELVGPEVGLLASEVSKLATYVGESPAIQRTDVARMVGAGRVETIWRTLEAATTGKAAEGLHDLDQLLSSGEHPVGLLAAMSASLRKVYHAGILRRAGRDLRESCREAGIPAFPGAVELTQKQHSHLGPTRVEALPGLLLRTDLELKGDSSLDPRVVLERLFIRLAGSRTD